MTLFLALFLDVALARRPALEPPPPPIKPDVVAGAAGRQAAGSLWSDSSSRLVTGVGATAHSVGDLITVRIDEHTATEIQGDTNATRESTTSARLTSLLGAETSIAAVRPAMGGGVKIEGGQNSDFSGEAGTRRGSQLMTTLTCEVIEELPGGNLKIWGYKQVRVNREVQYVVLTGVVRGRDIRLDNTIGSDLLADAKIEVTGNGVVGDKQGPGVGQRFIDRIWPF